MPVPLMDIRGQYAHLLDDVKRAACDVIDSGRFILGPNVRALEEEVADALGARHAVAVANGTDAIVLALEALMVGPGDEVICPAHTFYATAEAVCPCRRHAGLRRHRPGDVQPRSGRRRGRRDREDARDRRRPPVRPARRPAGAARDRRPARARARRGRRPGLRRPLRPPPGGDVRRRRHALVLPQQEPPGDGRRRDGARARPRRRRPRAHAALPRLARQARIRARRDELAP